MSIAPTVNSVWRYIGPSLETPPMQLHKVIFAKPAEVITIGLPFGRGGTWLGPAQLFAKEFEYVGEDKP